VILNRFPYNNGHLLVSPKAHKATLADLTSDELLDLQLTLRKMIGIIEKRMTPDGFNVGLNLGRAAGGGRSRAPALAHRPAMERRHQLHTRPHRHAGHFAVARRAL